MSSAKRRIWKYELTGGWDMSISKGCEIAEYLDNMHTTYCKLKGNM